MFPNTTVSSGSLLCSQEDKTSVATLLSSPSLDLLFSSRRNASDLRREGAAKSCTFVRIVALTIAYHTSYAFKSKRFVLVFAKSYLHSRTHFTQSYSYCRVHTVVFLLQCCPRRSLSCGRRTATGGCGTGAASCTIQPAGPPLLSGEPRKQNPT